MSSNLESRHFFMVDDRVQRLDGQQGQVVEAMALWAVIRWDREGDREVDQLDPTVEVIHRATIGMRDEG